MSKYVKELLENELAKKFKNIDDFLVVVTKGVDGNENNEMRGILKEKGIKLTVVKNALMRRAMEGLGKTAAASLFLSGPCTVVYGGDNIVDMARELANWAEKIEAVSLKGAFVDGVVMNTEEARVLSKMPSRAELQGKIIILANCPGANVAGAVAGPGGLIAGCIKSLVQRLEKEAA